MENRKIVKKYYFTVEGETEKWYLDRLKDIINEAEKSLCNVSFDIKIQKNPLKRAKSISNVNKITIWHFSDYESNDEVHTKQFYSTMDNMKEAMDLKKGITYKFGYSNFTFDLWIILHRIDCNCSLLHRDMYIKHIMRTLRIWINISTNKTSKDAFANYSFRMSLKQLIVQK